MSRCIDCVASELIESQERSESELKQAKSMIDELRLRLQEVVVERDDARRELSRLRKAACNITIACHISTGHKEMGDLVDLLSETPR